MIYLFNVTFHLVFQVTMLPEGDTQVNAEDMTRLSESPGLARTGVSSLQLIYATLSTISENSDLALLAEGRSAILTVELLNSIHTTVLSSVQDGVTIHSITYHLPGSEVKEMANLVSINHNRDKDYSCGEEINRTTKANDEVLRNLLRENRDVSEIQKPEMEKEVFLIGTDVIAVDNLNKEGMKLDSSSVFVGEGNIDKKHKETESKLGGSSALREMLISGTTKMPMVDNSSFMQMNFITDSTETNTL